MSKTTSMVTGARGGRPKNVLRKSLVPGDLFVRPNGTKGRVYMHTSKRTAPPSGRTLTVDFNGQKQHIDLFKRCEAQGGKDVIGYQAIIVDGPIDEGEDGGTVTYDGNAVVTLVGKAKIELDRWD